MDFNLLRNRVADEERVSTARTELALLRAQAPLVPASHQRGKVLRRASPSAGVAPSWDAAVAAVNAELAGVRVPDGRLDATGWDAAVAAVNAELAGCCAQDGAPRATGWDAAVALINRGALAGSTARGPVNEALA